MWVNRSWTQTEIPWHLWISITLGLQRMNLILNMAILGRSPVLLTPNKCRAAIIQVALWIYQKKILHLYIFCVLSMNLRTNAAYRQMDVGNGRFILLHLQQRRKTNEHIEDITSESWKQNKSRKERSDRKWTEKGSAEMEDGSYRCSGGTLGRCKVGRRPRPWN